MSMSMAGKFLLLAYLAASIGDGSAQGPAPQAMPQATPAKEGKLDFGILQGNWVRPDGGYRIAIKSVAADGKLEAMYFNPDALPFAKALASRDGATLHASFELQAGGYAGSSYELAYDPVSDRLKGTYHQAVQGRSYEILFVRK
jgi:hypothetical protein